MKTKGLNRVNKVKDYINVEEERSRYGYKMSTKGKKLCRKMTHPGTNISG